MATGDPNDNTQPSPGPGWTQLPSGDWAPPHSKEIEYQVNSHGVPTLGKAGLGQGVTGHTNQADGATVRAQTAASYKESRAQAQAKHDAQVRRDTSGALPQHATVTYKPSPLPSVTVKPTRKGKGK